MLSRHFPYGLFLIASNRSPLQERDANGRRSGVPGREQILCQNKRVLDA